MKNFIGNIHDTRELTEKQKKKAEETIKKMLNLDTVEIGVPERKSGFYPVSTNDDNIIDFKLDNYNKDKVSLVKYIALDDDGNRDPYGGILTCPPVKCEE